MASVDLLGALGNRARRRAPLLAAVFVATSVATAAAWMRYYDPGIPVTENTVLSANESSDPDSDSDLSVTPAADTFAGTRQIEIATPSILAERDLADWLSEIASEAELGIVLGKGVGGPTTALFPALIGWRAKLDALAAASGFSYAIRDGLIEVRARASKPRVADEAGEMPGRSTSGVEATQGSVPSAAVWVPRPSTTTTHRLLNARAEDLARVLEDSLGARGLVATADSPSNILVISGTEASVRAAAALIEALDVPRRKFLLEARIVEMLAATRSELGIQWRLDSGDFGAGVNFPADETGTTGGDGSEITVATTGTISLRARLSALEADGKVRVIARPRVLVVEGHPALIESVRILRIRLPDRAAVVTDSDDFSAPDAGRAVEEFPVGISLRVEPSLVGGDDVSLHIVAKSSTLGEPLPPDNIPEEFSRLVEADVIVADGHTAVLGGLSRVGRSRRSAGVPLLRDLPWVGALFGRRGHERDSEELLVLVTPRLLP